MISVIYPPIVGIYPPHHNCMIQAVKQIYPTATLKVFVWYLYHDTIQMPLMWKYRIDLSISVVVRRIYANHKRFTQVANLKAISLTKFLFLSDVVVTISTGAFRSEQQNICRTCLGFNILSLINLVKK